MPTVSWPVTLAGDYSDGSVCKASDYKNDFEKLRDAVNQLHERFNTFAWSCSFRKPLYHLTESGGAARLLRLSAVDDDDYVVLGVLQVPTWCQAVRLRDFQCMSNGCFDYGDTSENVAQGFPGTLSSDEKLRIGVRVAETLADAYASDNLESTTTALTHFELAGGLAAAFLEGNDVNAFELQQVSEASLSSQIVNAGEYIVVFARLYDSSTGTGVKPSLLPNADARHWVSLQATLLFDCLAPVP